MKLLANSENLEAAILTRTLYRNPPVVLKYHTGSHLGDVNLVFTQIFPAYNETRTKEKIDQGQREKPVCDAFGRILRISM
jgi:hypothetical protein